MDTRREIKTDVEPADGAGETSGSNLVESFDPGVRTHQLQVRTV
jgi:hypothetical protein